MPTAIPMAAVHHRPAAVVRPFMWLFLVTRMVPAPRKPIPLITCAGILAGSEALRASTMKRLVIHARAEPTHTIM